MKGVVCVGGEGNGWMRIPSAPVWLASDIGRPPIVDGVERLDGAAGDATRAMGRVLGFCAMAVRGGVGVLGGFAAVLGMSAPVRPAAGEGGCRGAGEPRLGGGLRRGYRPARAADLGNGRWTSR
jgi:hypothetical protein